MSNMKKGNTSWRPSNLGDVLDKEEGFRYRWVRKDDDNVAKKKDEGWEFVSKINSPSTSSIHPAGRPDEPHQLTSNVERRDGVLMRLDDETAKQRDEYVNGLTSRRETGLKLQTQKELKGEASVHGNITKERKGIKTIV